jgi:pimeloyl-ACP methyl ester carboxylesterase
MSIHNRTTHSSDGVLIAYSISGSAEPVLLFIHGGLADRSFWSGQHAAFSNHFKVIALDLAGHGESGSGRLERGIRQFASDVASVVAAERLHQVILVGNSLGGTVAIEAALSLGEHALGVVGVDTFHDLGRRIDPGWIREQTNAWRRDFHGTLNQMVRALFHPDADPALLTDVRQRMTRTSPETVAAMFSSLEGYDTGLAARQLRIPIRCINGDLFPTDVQSVRTVVEDFDAVILPHTGHFPMLECPEKFNCALMDITIAMAGRAQPQQGT